MHFKDRIEAAELLLEKLLPYKGLNPLVLGIPRGAMPMASVIAKGLKGELGVVLVHKIPFPFNEEVAIGSVGLSGHIHPLPDISAYDISESYVLRTAEEQVNKLKVCQEQYGLKTPDYHHRIVIIVDDGIATGATTLGAIHEVLHHRPEKLILAASVASQESAQKLATLVDEWVVLDTPEDFYAVGQFFTDFSQVSDEEVIALLNEHKKINKGFSPKTL